ncbi:copper resistance CopC family protein [Actinocorallia longicatena]|uniref:Copper resistance protein CopC n=1 Tax=Actinocorallia longicatena TaxID=111803 RepID=A0ABP6QAZ9_9ACTN
MTARRFALPLAVAFAPLLLAAPASAHTELTGSTPGNGATLASAPARIALTFNENLRAGLVKIKIMGANDETWQRGKPAVQGNKVDQPVMPDLPNGAYTVGYRVVSEDGHPVTGTLEFTVNKTSTAPAGTADAPEASATPVASASSEGGAMRWLMVGAGIAAGIGIGIVFSMRRRRG